MASGILFLQLQMCVVEGERERDENNRWAKLRFSRETTEKQLLGIFKYLLLMFLHFDATPSSATENKFMCCMNLQGRIHSSM